MNPRKIPRRTTPPVINQTTIELPIQSVKFFQVSQTKYNNVAEIKKLSIVEILFLVLGFSPNLYFAILFYIYNSIY